MNSLDFSSTIEILDRDACEQLLSQQLTGRIAFDEDEFPTILPVNFVYLEGLVAFRTDPGSKLTNVPMRPVAFEVDGWDQRSAWSVVIQGHARDVTNALGERYEALRASHIALLAPGDKEHWIAIEVRTISGRRIALRQPASPEQ